MNLGDVDLGNVDLSGVDLGNLDLSSVDLGDIELPDLDAPPSGMSGALGSGVDTMQGGLWRTAAEAAGAMGFNETSEEWKTKARDNLYESRKYVPTITSYRDVEDLSSFGDYAGELIAGAAPYIAPYLIPYFGRYAGAANTAASSFGEVINEQEAAGQEIDYSRAALSATIDVATAMPLAKAFSKATTAAAAGEITEQGTKNIAKEFVKGVAVDSAANAASHVGRTYGIQGELSLEGVDEAIVGGGVIAVPSRGAVAVAQKVNKDSLAKITAEDLVKTGDIKKADGIIQSGLNFIVGGALRKTRRFKNTPTGRLFDAAINKMQQDRDLMGNDFYVRTEEVFRGLNEAETNDLIRRYSEGDRSDVRLQSLATLMDEVQTRAERSLGTEYLANYLPTLLDTDFDTDGMLRDYVAWYDTQPLDRKIPQGRNPNPELPPPDEAAKIIREFQAKLEDGEHGRPVTMKRGKMDKNGKVKFRPPTNTSSPLKYGALDGTRELGFIPQSIITKYANTKHMKEQIQNYGFSAAQRITYAEQLGKNNEKLQEMIYNMDKEMRQIARYKGLKERDYRITRGEFDNFYDAMDAYQGLYGQFEHESVRRASAIFRTGSSTVALVLSTLSSLTEPLNLAIKVGGHKAVKAYAQAMKSIFYNEILSAVTRNKLVPRSETGKILSMIGRGFSNAAGNLQARIDADLSSRAFDKVSSVYFHATLQTSMNYFVNQASAHAALEQSWNDVNIINSLSPDSRAYLHAKQRLEALGINEAEARSMAGNKDLFNDAGTRIVYNFNKDVALQPETLDKPLWASTGWGKFFFQLRSYPTMYTNVVLPQLFGMLDPRGKTAAELTSEAIRFAGTTGMLLSIGFMQEAMKNELKGKDMEDEEVLLKAVRNIVTPIHVGYLMDAATGNTAKLMAPAAAGITDRQVAALWRAMRGEGEQEDIPFLQHFKGVL